MSKTADNPNHLAELTASYKVARASCQVAGVLFHQFGDPYRLAYEARTIGFAILRFELGITTRRIAELLGFTYAEVESCLRDHVEKTSPSLSLKPSDELYVRKFEEALSHYKSRKL